MRNCVIFALATVLTFSFVQHSSADPIIFTDRASFDAAVALRGTVSSNGFNSSFLRSNSVDFGDFTISTPTVTGIFPASSSSEGPLAAGFQSTFPGSATIAFDSPINALALDLVDWAGGVFPTGENHTLSASTNTGSFSQVLATGPDSRGDKNVVFLGLIDDNPFNSVTINSTTGADTIGLDDLDYGLVSAVPEPGSGALVLTLCVCFANRRQRRSE